MPADEPAALLLLAGCLAVAGAAAAVALSSRPRAVVLIALLAPCIPSALVPNSALGEAEPGRLGGYVRVSLLLLAGGAGLLAFVRRRLRQGEPVPGQHLLLAAFAAWAAASAFYSADPAHTALRVVALAGLVCLVLGLHAWLGEEDGPEAVLRAVIWFVALFAAANAAAAFLWPAKAWWWSSPARLQGLTSHPNTLGGFCMASYPVLLWQYARSRGTARAGVALLGAVVASMHLLSGSRTSLACAVLGMGVWLLAARRRAAFACFAAAAALAWALLIAAPPASFERKYEDDASVNLTGRQDIWRSGWYLVRKRPLHGFGYDAERKVLDDAGFQSAARIRLSAMASQSLHNGYLSIMAGTGAIGLAIWLAALGLPCARAWRLPPGAAKSLALAVMSMAFASNLFESHVTVATSPPAAMFWVVWALAGRLVADAPAPAPPRAPEGEVPA